MDELAQIAKEILDEIHKEDLEEDFKKGGMYRSVIKAKEIQNH